MIQQGDHYFGQVGLQFTRQRIEQRRRLMMVAVILTGLPVIMVIIIGTDCTMRRLPIPGIPFILWRRAVLAPIMGT
jgi:hypothetical protein